MALEERELVNYIEWEMDESLGEDEIRQEREKALQYYYGEKVGTLAHPGEGRSSVVMLTVRESIEIAMPILMQLLTETDDMIEFDPVGKMGANGKPDLLANALEEAAAKQQSDYLNHVYYKHNPGFENTYVWLKEGLLQKNGYVKAWVDDTASYCEDVLRGQLAQDVSKLQADPLVEILEVEEEDNLIIDLFQTYEVHVRRRKPKRIRIEPEPSEYIRISSDATRVCLQDARFVAIHKDITKSELIEMFPDKKSEIMSIGDGEDSDLRNSRFYRYNKSDEDRDRTPPDEAMRSVPYTQCWYKVDIDEDNIAERYFIQKAGNVLLKKTPVSHVQLFGWTPIIEPHKHVGLSFADLTMELQDIFTTLWRQMLDNLYLSNAPEKEVVEDWLAPDGLDDLLASRVGGIKRVERPNAIREIVVPFTAGNSVPILELLDKVIAKRTGVSDDMLSMSPDVLRQANTGVVAQALDTAMSRLKLVARTFAETGLKPLFLGIQKLMLEGGFQSEVVKLRGNWVAVNPAEWLERTSMTVHLGGPKSAMATGLQSIMQIQQAMAEGGLQTVSQKEFYNSAMDYAKHLGLGKDATRYFVDPETIPPQPEEPSMEEQIAMLLAQVEQGKLQLEAQKQQIDAQLKQAELALSQQRNVIQQQKVGDEAVDRRTKMELEYQKNVPGAGV